MNSFATHYKWNPIEHRLFSAVSGNWRDVLLEPSYGDQSLK
ncbi:MAG: hypothetical protein JRH15_21335 [Deltaproteobacteria bacterium]|nr:hypothetical protein [Deltaproteobacteria bacterium]